VNANAIADVKGADLAALIAQLRVNRRHVTSTDLESDGVALCRLSAKDT